MNLTLDSVMDKASLKSFSIFNLVLKSVLIYFIDGNTGSPRKIYNFSQLLNKFQITLPQMRDYPKRVITPLLRATALNEPKNLGITERSGHCISCFCDVVDVKGQRSEASI